MLLNADSVVLSCLGFKISHIPDSHWHCNHLHTFEDQHELTGCRLPVALSLRMSLSYIPWATRMQYSQARKLGLHPFMAVCCKQKTHVCHPHYLLWSKSRYFSLLPVACLVAVLSLLEQVMDRHWCSTRFPIGFFFSQTHSFFILPWCSFGIK